MKQLDQYKEIIEKAKEDIKIEGKTIQEACTEHASLFLFYYDKLCELRNISDNIRIEVDKFKSLQTKRYSENHSRDLGYQLISKYIESEPDVIKAKQLLAEVDEIKNKFEAIKEAFISRGYQLNNITKQRVTEIEEGLL